jgi:hypothetical protein
MGLLLGQSCPLQRPFAGGGSELGPISEYFCNFVVQDPQEMQKKHPYYLTIICYQLLNTSNISAGDLSEAEVAAILSNHEKELDKINGQLDKDKQAHLAELRRKLAERRRMKEGRLREKQEQEVRLFTSPFTCNCVDTHNCLRVLVTNDSEFAPLPIFPLQIRPIRPLQIRYTNILSSVSHGRACVEVPIR